MPLQSGNVHSWWCAFQEAIETAASRSPHEIPLLFANPNLKFGVNCYGIKPKAKQRELDMMEANKTKILPHSKNQIAAERGDLVLFFGRKMPISYNPSMLITMTRFNEWVSEW